MVSLRNDGHRAVTEEAEASAGRLGVVKRLEAQSGKASHVLRIAAYLAQAAVTAAKHLRPKQHWGERWSAARAACLSLSALAA